MLRRTWWMFWVLPVLAGCTVDNSDQCLSLCTDVFDECAAGCDSEDDECSVTCENDRDVCLTSCDEDDGQGTDG